MWKRILKSLRAERCSCTMWRVNSKNVSKWLRTIVIKRKMKSCSRWKNYLKELTDFNIVMTVIHHLFLCFLLIPSKLHPSQVSVWNFLQCVLHLTSSPSLFIWIIHWIQGILFGFKQVSRMRDVPQDNRGRRMGRERGKRWVSEKKWQARGGAKFGWKWMGVYMERSSTISCLFTSFWQLWLV